MEFKFIKLDGLNAANPRDDTPVFIRCDQILAISEASMQDKNRREEIESIVRMITDCYAVRQTPEEIINLMKESEI